MALNQAEIVARPVVTASPTPAVSRAGRWRAALSRKNVAILAGQLAVVVVVLAILQWLVDSGRVGSMYMASPTQILGVFPHLITEEHLFGNLLITLYEAVVGTVLAFVFGVGTGIYMGLSRTGERFLNPFVGAAMAVPKVTIIPLLTLYLGVGVNHKIVIVFLFGYFMFVFNTIAGIKQVQESHLKVARANGASRLQTIIKVILPLRHRASLLLCGSSRNGPGRGPVCGNHRLESRAGQHAQPGHRRLRHRDPVRAGPVHHGVLRPHHRGREPAGEEGPSSMEVRLIHPFDPFTAHRPAQKEQACSPRDP